MKLRDKQKKYHYISVLLDPDIIAKLQALATQQDRTTAHIVRQLIIKALQEDKEQ